MQIVLLAVIGASSIVVNESATKPPLMFSKWPPPPYQNNKSPSLRQQIFHQLRSNGRIPSNMIVKRYPPSISQSMSYMMRPMKYAQLKKVPIPAPSYYKPTISTPPRYRFQSSPSAPNTGEYVFENPFNSYGYQSPVAPVSPIAPVCTTNFCERFFCLDRVRKRVFFLSSRIKRR